MTGIIDFGEARRRRQVREDAWMAWYQRVYELDCEREEAGLPPLTVADLPPFPDGSSPWLG